jgi:hypothetical protein
VTDALFVHDRPVPPAWQQALEVIVPKSDRVPWLQLAWMPGMLYSPVQRYVIYEVVPIVDLPNGECNIPADRLRDIRGTSPRERGQWVVDPSIPEHLGGKRWVSESLHSLVQWQLFHATGGTAYPLLFWILQGDQGGHVWRLDSVTRNFCLSLDGHDVPNPGELPYAEWDNRVAEQIGRFDRLRRWHALMQTPWTDRQLNKTDAGLWVDRETWDLEKQYAKEMLRFLDMQIEEVVSDIPRRLLPGWSDLPPGDRYYNRGAEELERSLIEDTSHAMPGSR